MFKFSCFASKGGLGKSTANLTLAANLGLRGYKVLIIDGDSQFNLSRGFGFDGSLKGTFEAILEKNPTKYIQKTKAPNVDLLPGSRGLAGMDFRLAQSKFTGFEVAEALRPLDGLYDVVIVDLGPNTGLFNVAVLTWLDAVVVPCETSVFGQDAISQTVELISLVKQKNPKLKIAGFFFPNFLVNLNVAKETEQLVRDAVGDLLFESRIRMNNALRVAASFGTPLPLMPKAKHCTAYWDYLHLTDELIRRVMSDVAATGETVNVG